MSAGPNATHLAPATFERWDELGAAERSEAWVHLGGCAACRARLAEQDPAALFGWLTEDPADEAVLDGLSARIDAALDALPSGRAPRGVRRWRGAAMALAASLLLAALAGWIGRGPWTGPEPAADPWAMAEPMMRAGAETGAGRAAGEIQVVSSPGQAQVLDLTVGDTQIVMIFDAELDL